MKQLIKAATISLGLLGLTACNKNDAPPTSPADGSTHTGAVNSIAQSRCQREMRCNNIGANRKYSSETDCLATIQNDWKDDLSARECKNGVSQSKLDECLAKIRAEDCGNPFDTLARISACTAGQICAN